LHISTAARVPAGSVASNSLISKSVFTVMGAG
jgi:hypothetical protein